MRIRGQRPTRKQKITIKASKLDPSKWLVTKNPVGELHILNKDSGKTRVISA